MDLPPEDMFFPVGAVVQHETGRVEPVLDPECRHDVKCVLGVQVEHHVDALCVQAERRACAQADKVRAHAS